MNFGIDLVARLVARLGVKRNEALFFCKSLDKRRRFSLCFAGVEKVLVFFAESVRRFGLAVIAEI